MSSVVCESGAVLTTGLKSALPPASDHLHGSLGGPCVEDLNRDRQDHANPGEASAWMLFSEHPVVEDSGPEPHDEEPDDVDEGKEPGVDVGGNDEAVEPAVKFHAVAVGSGHDEEDCDWEHGGKVNRGPNPGEEGNDGAEVRELGGPSSHEDEHPESEDPGCDTVGQVSTPVVGWVVVVCTEHDNWGIHN